MKPFLPMNTYKVTAIITRNTNNARQIVNFNLQAANKQDAELLAPEALNECLKEDFKNDPQNPFKNIIKTEFIISETENRKVTN